MANKVYSAWLPNVSHDTIYRTLATSENKKMNEIEVYIGSMKSFCPEILDEHLVEFKKSLEIINKKKKDYIFKEQEVHNAIYFVISGLVRSCYLNDKGDEKNAWFIQENDFVTDYPCFLESTSSHYTFQCLEDCVLVKLPKEAILTAYNTFPSIDKYGRLIAEEIIKMMQYRIESLLFLSAKERYLQVLNNERNLVNRVSVAALSSYLGIERQTLTRIRKEIMNQE